MQGRSQDFSKGGVTEATHRIVMSYYRGMKAHIN